MTPEQYDREVRARPQSDAAGYRHERDGPVLRLVGPTAGSQDNGVVWSDLGEDDADAAIARQVALFGGLGRAFEWKLYDHDRPADLARRLERAGFVAGAPETLVVLDLQQPPAPREPPPGVLLRRLDRAEDLAPLVDLNVAVYGDRAQAEWLVSTLAAELTSGALVVLGAFAGDLAVSAGWARLPAGSAWASLWGGATRAAWRGRGVYSALVAARADEARARGRRWLAVDCSPHSLPILMRRGFRPLARTTPWTWTP